MRYLIALLYVTSTRRGESRVEFIPFLAHSCATFEIRSWLLSPFKWPRLGLPEFFFLGLFIVVAVFLGPR